MKTPTEEDFSKIFREQEAMTGALVGMVNYLLKRERPMKVREKLTDTEMYELLSFFHCPDCHEKIFLKDPEGGLSINIKCAGCGSKFNICPPYFAKRIQEKRETPETETIFCTWSEQENGPWLSACGEDFNLEDGTPVENKMKFCCWCGKPLKEKLFVEED